MIKLSEITVVVTSCGRRDLLIQTIESFCKYNTHPIAKMIVVEDGPQGDISCFAPYSMQFIATGNRVGQLNAIDRAYTEVTTPYIFHLEDDWEFYKESFIEPSLEILEAYPEVLQVHLRALNDLNGHPVEKLARYPFYTLAPNYQKVWHGFSFNPGLRRRSDYIRIGGRYGAYEPYKIGHADEIPLSHLYYSLGYVAAITNSGYVRHLGWTRHVS